MRLKKRVGLLFLFLCGVPAMILIYLALGTHHTTSLSGQNDVMGFNNREASLAARVREVEEQNQMLRKQLSLSENKLLNMQYNVAAAVETVENGSLVLSPPNTTNIRCINAEPDVPKCQVIQVAIVCAGHSATRDVVTLIKSILFYRKNPLHFHFISDLAAQTSLQTLFKTWDLSGVEVSFYSAQEVEPDVSWIPNKHYSGVYGLMKLTLPKIMPRDMEKVIVLDTDIIFASDIASLWKIFNSFQTRQAIGLVENQSDWYLGKLWKNHRPWPALGRGFNTGVILADLQKLRDLDWMQVWREVAEKYLITMSTTALADQVRVRPSMASCHSMEHALSPSELWSERVINCLVSIRPDLRLK